MIGNPQKLSLPQLPLRKDDTSFLFLMFPQVAMWSINSLQAAAHFQCHCCNLVLGSTWAGHCTHRESHWLPSLPKIFHIWIQLHDQRLTLSSVKWWNITIEYCSVVQITYYSAVGATIKGKKRITWHVSFVSFIQSRVFCRQLLENLNCLAHTSITSRCWFLLRITKYFAPFIFCWDFYPIAPSI